MRTLMIVMILALLAAVMVTCYAALIVSSEAQKWDEPDMESGQGKAEADTSSPEDNL